MGTKSLLFFLEKIFTGKKIQFLISIYIICAFYKTSVKFKKLEHIYMQNDDDYCVDNA